LALITPTREEGKNPERFFTTGGIIFWHYREDMSTLTPSHPNAFLGLGGHATH
jgi:hypothetical protein